MQLRYHILLAEIVHGLAGLPPLKIPQFVETLINIGLAGIRSSVGVGLHSPCLLERHAPPHLPHP